MLGPAGGVFTPNSGLGLRMVKELGLQLALGMNERRKTGSLPTNQNDVKFDHTNIDFYYIIFIYTCFEGSIVHGVKLGFGSASCDASNWRASFSGYSGSV